MTKNIRWVDSHIEIDPIKKNKKITGTRLAAVLGMNKWSSPFKAWCEITRTYEEPFEDTIYTIAGKTIEPIIIDFLKERLYLDLETPTDVWGSDYFKKTWGDFYKDRETFGGMWDVKSRDGRTMVEIKTTKRSEDWISDVPEYYLIQGFLYAYLSDCKEVVFPCAFLTDADYQAPEKFKPVLGKNLVVYTYKMEDLLRRYNYVIVEAEHFWHKYVLTGISPDYDEKRDADIIKALRTATETPEGEEAETLIKEIDELEYQLEALKKQMKPIETELKGKSDALKKYLKTKVTDDIDKVEINSPRYVWTLQRVNGTTIDKDALEADGILTKYQKPTTTYKLTNKIIKK